MPLIPTIICGGAGARLWPLSRSLHPKPFIALFGEQSLLQKTVSRATRLDGVGELLTVTNDALLFLALEQYQTVVPEQLHQHFILEPEGRDTAGAAIAAALHIQARFGDEATMLLMPADHLIEDFDSFQASVTQAERLADQGQIVVFGIQPKGPETGYGYIEADGDRVSRFVEKPDEVTAQYYLDQGTYFWNAGMVCAQVGAFLAAVQANAGKMLADIRLAIKRGSPYDNDKTSRTQLNPEIYSRVEKISLDYALLEKTHGLRLVPCAFDWSDIGSWSAVGAASHHDEAGNSVTGEALLLDTKNTHIQTDGRLVAAIGLDDLLIVDTPDALLVGHKSCGEQVKQAYQKLVDQGHGATELHRTVFRPWGSYTILEEGKNFKVKRIEVKPGAVLSLQSHHHRSEHWVVVTGKASVVNGRDEIDLKPNQSTYIPCGIQHRLANHTDEPLAIIEVQTGDYLGEDDIVRYDDAYGRVSAA